MIYLIVYDATNGGLGWEFPSFVFDEAKEALEMQQFWEYVNGAVAILEYS